MGIQRTDLKGLEKLQMTALTFDVWKSFMFDFIQLRFGTGSIFYRKYSYNDYLSNSEEKDGKFNFLGLDAVISFFEFNFGCNTYINSKTIMGSIFIQKEIF